jgi:hypothetical protein
LPAYFPNTTPLLAAYYLKTACMLPVYCLNSA